MDREIECAPRVRPYPPEARLQSIRAGHSTKSTGDKRRGQPLRRLEWRAWPKTLTCRPSGTELGIEEEKDTDSRAGWLPAEQVAGFASAFGYKSAGWRR